MCRWHEPHPGFWSELREPSQGMLREKLQKWTFEADNTEVRAWGGAIRSSDESPVMGVERRDGVFIAESMDN